MRADGTTGDLQRFHDRLATMPTRQGGRERMLRAIFGAWCRVTAWRLEVVGQASLPHGDSVPGAGCIVVAAPHRAWVEPFLLLAAWPPNAARLVWLADGGTVTRTWWRRWLLPRVGIIPVAPSAGGPRAYSDAAAAACQRGFAVAVFPEVGPPSPPDRPRRISPGFAYMALRAGAPVVPVVVGGTHRIVRGSSFSLDILPAIAASSGTDPFSPAARSATQALVRRYEQLVSGSLPERTAAADATAPERERWRWLGSLFG
jgi:1-acyl-sn-glycerol-3-phosphate acyltransferase